jgi:hypothetical protein
MCLRFIVRTTLIMERRYHRHRTKSRDVVGVGRIPEASPVLPDAEVCFGCEIVGGGQLNIVPKAAIPAASAATRSPCGLLTSDNTCLKAYAAERHPQSRLDGDQWLRENRRPLADGLPSSVRC